MKTEKMQVLKAHKEDLTILNQITFASKQFWGYSDEQMEAWKEMLTMSESYLTENTVYKLVQEEILGYYSFIIFENYVELDNLFIKPEKIGKGLGTFLLQHLLDEITKLGHHKIVLFADPNAERFYKKMGFQVIGSKPTQDKTRFLPIMELNL
ncbi:MAG: GNAT family N-acetyltransferase [Flavobacterium sp.]